MFVFVDAKDSNIELHVEQQRIAQQAHQQNLHLCSQPTTSPSDSQSIAAVQLTSVMKKDSQHPETLLCL